MNRFLSTICLAAAGFTAATAADLPAGYTVTPTPGSTLEQIEQISVKAGWPQCFKQEASIVINGQNIATSVKVTDMDGSGDAEVVFTLAEPYTKTGKCNVIIPEGTFTVGWEEDPCKFLEFSYVIDNDFGGGDDPNPGDIQNTVPDGYTFTPAAGTEVTALTQFSVTATNDMFLTGASRTLKVTVNGEAVQGIRNVSGELKNTLTWELAYPITEPGYYTIYIPAGEFYGYNEEDNQPFLVTVIVTGGEAPTPDWFDGEMTSDPASGSTVKELQKIAIMSPKLTSLYEGPEAGKITVEDTAGPVDTPFTLTPDEDNFNEAHVIWMEFAEPLTAPYEYTITFPAKSFSVAKYPEEHYTAPFTLTFKVDELQGIEGLPADSGIDESQAEYYTLDGRRIAKPTASGLYLRRTAGRTTKLIVK